MTYKKSRISRLTERNGMLEYEIEFFFSGMEESKKELVKNRTDEFIKYIQTILRED